MEYFAHINEAGARQTVREHLEGTAVKAKVFAESFGAEKHADNVGKAHDVGKYSDEFQKRILDNGPRTDHSTAGAVELKEKNDLLGAICVAGHHGGLPDCGTRVDSSDDATLWGRCKRKTEKNKAGREKYDAFRKEIQLKNMEPNEVIPFPPDEDLFKNVFFYTKFLFSCLVDADWLDTEEFMTGSARSYPYNTMDELEQRLDSHVQKWGNPTTELNRIRCDIFDRCRSAGDEEKGLFSLTTPTGGGKTTASLAFALRHACRHGMNRIIYVIPYINIIEQSVEVFEGILGEQNVLAHYSEAVYEDEGDDFGNAKKKLAVENWDAPVVVTTAVQFFESLFSCKPSKSRKLHNIADSVIIFDEYQMIPVKHMFPCTEAIYQMVKNFNCTVLLCTATQPGTNRFFHGVDCREIIEDTERLYERLKRVTYCDIGRIEKEQLGESFNAENQVLCIVNTRKSAQELFELLDGEGNYHLSTYMIPMHRRKILKEIRDRLKQGKNCRVISTSLIEAGVDVDFPVVYREENGLDSIVQAAGRCNREGKKSAEDSKVFIFQVEGGVPVGQRINRDAMRETFSFGHQIGSTDATKCYFNTLYDLKGEDALDADSILKMIREGAKSGPLPFRTISEKFRMIDNDTKTVYIPFDENGDALCRRLEEGERSRDLYRELGQYSVNLYERTYRKLEAQGVILEFDEGAAVLNNMNYYSAFTGLVIPDEEEGSGFFI